MDGAGCLHSPVVMESPQEIQRSTDHEARVSSLPLGAGCLTEIERETETIMNEQTSVSNRRAVRRSDAKLPNVVGGVGHAKSDRR